MNQHKPTQRILAWTLSIVMVLGMTPITAMAETMPIGTSGEIIAFEELSEETGNREVPLGTSLKDLDLLDTLNATVRVATPTNAEKPEPDSGELQFEGKSISVPVTWASVPDYDSETEGTYTFTAKLNLGDNMVLAEDVTLPTIEVEVSPDLLPISMALNVTNESPAAPPPPVFIGKWETMIAVAWPSEVDTSIVLQITGGLVYHWMDYSFNSGTVTFALLTPNTEYSFYLRYKETYNSEASPPSEPLTITTDKATLTGSVSITGTPKYDETLTADTTNMTTNVNNYLEFGTLSYQWMRNGSDIPGATDSSYTLAAEDIGSTITVVVSSDNCTGSVTSGTTTEVVKADGPAAPDSVTGSYTGNGTTFTYTVNAISDAEYRMDDGGAWQDQNTFTGIVPSSSHTFYARISIKETATHKEGAAGNTGAITFEKLDDRSAPPLAYTATGGNYNRTITVTQVAGAEYKFDSGEWGSANSKGGYTSADTVPVQIRYTATDTHNESPANSVNLNLAKQNQAAPAIQMSYAYVSGSNTFTVTIAAQAGCQYSFDGTNWDSQNTKAGCAPGDTVTGYIRKAETGSHNASSYTSKTIVLPVPVTSIVVSVTGGASTITTNRGTLQMLAEVQPSGATQAVTWSVSGSGASISSAGLLTATTNGTVTVRATATDGTGIYGEMTVTISGQYSGGGGGGGSDSGSSVIVTPPAPDKPNTPTQGEIKVDAQVSNGNATVTVTEKAIADAFDKALAEAKKNGNEQNGITLVLAVNTGGQTVNSVTFNLPKSVQDFIISKGIVNTVVVVENPDITINMDLAAVKEINKQAGADVNITATRRDNSTLTDSAKAAIGSRPVFDLKVSYGSGKAVQSFGAGSVSVTIPYTLGAGENAGNVQAVFVDESGKVQWLTSSVYDSLNKVLRFSTNHFSTYGVGYKQNALAFTDAGSHWAKDDIAFVVNRGLFSGTSATTFSPNTAMTRGMFVTALGRLANTDVSAYKQSSFTDVKNDAYYMGYVEWASKNTIVNGVGNGKFAPDQSITREQMAVIMSNYAKTIGFTLPKVHVENTFADNAKISTYAKEAVKQMQMAGVISGKKGNLFDPQGTATRAEVSAVLRRFVELAISSDTAQGWTMNDSGKWMYFKDGKPLTGKQDIDGATYTFDQYGVTADMPKNLRYTTYTVQKGDSFWSIARKLDCTMSELERLNNKSRFSLIHPGDVLRVPEK